MGAVRFVGDVPAKPDWERIPGLGHVRSGILGNYYA